MIKAKQCAVFGIKAAAGFVFTKHLSIVPVEAVKYDGESSMILSAIAFLVLAKEVRAQTLFIKMKLNISL